MIDFVNAVDAMRPWACVSSLSMEKTADDVIFPGVSRSRSVEVIKPLHLRQRIHEILKQALDRNRVEDAGNDRGS